MRSSDRRSAYAYLTLGLALALRPGLAAAAPPATEAEAPAQAPTSDEVNLKSGGFVTGQLTEYLPGDHVTIIPTGSQQAREIPWSEVDSVVRKGQRLEAPVEATGGEAAAPTDGGWEDPTATPAGPAPGGEPASSGVQSTVPAAPSPSSEGTPLRVEQQGGKRPATLYHIDGEATGMSGNVVVHAIAYSEVCTAPCEGKILKPGGDFFVGGKSYAPSRRFQLPRSSSGYDLMIKPRHKALGLTGWLITSLGIGGAAAMLTASFLEDMPIGMARGLRAGGVTLGVVGLGGGITLLVFGRSKVEVLPRP